MMQAGCAVMPVYSPANDKTKDDWDACRQEAVHWYYQNRNGSGMAVGSVLLGPVGSLIGDGMANTGGVKPEDMNTYTDKCMVQKGYKIISGKTEG